jgi:hypothetical protein
MQWLPTLTITDVGHARRFYGQTDLLALPFQQSDGAGPVQTWPRLPAQDAPPVIRARGVCRFSSAADVLSPLALVSGLLGLVARIVAVVSADAQDGAGRHDIYIRCGAVAGLLHPARMAHRPGRLDRLGFIGIPW